MIESGNQHVLKVGIWGNIECIFYSKKRDIDRSPIFYFTWTKKKAFGVTLKINDKGQRRLKGDYIKCTMVAPLCY